jgi:diguanylate cyclase (GGDEF)-like protein
MSAPDNPAMQPPPDSRPEAPRVSVIVRTIGRASLDAALASVAAQTYRPIEIVLVEAQGGSGQAWPPDLQGVDLQVPATGGQRLARAAAANFGLRHARGELALFLDDDDLLLPMHIARLQAALAAAPAAPAAFTDTDYGYPDAEGWHSLHRFEGGFDAVRLRFENFLPIHSVLFRLDARTPRVDEAFDLFEDWDFWLQMARLGDFVHVPGISARYVAAEGQRSGVFVDSPATRQARQQLLAKWQTTSTAAGHAALVDRLQQVLATSERTGDNTAVLFVDLDNFKTLNDTRGHEVGDLLLKQVATRLRTGVREQDTVARLGGDEFVVVLQSLSPDAREAAAHTRVLGEKLLHDLRQPYDLAGYEHHITASIGVTLLRDHLAPLDEVLKQADMAMYRAKDAGRNTLRFFDPDMQQAVNRRALLESELHTGLRMSQFLLLYQPQVDSCGCVTGAEALVRWQHPVRGMVSPAEFIPLAEETGLILPLGDWVMETAMRQQALWRGIPGLTHLQLAINVSARQFLQEHFVDQLLAMVARTGANPHNIKLELTESLLLDNVDDVIAIMRALKAHGLGFALDDFGTGYSSLSYLKRLPLDQIKIDQGFVRDVLLDASDAAIARSIIGLADSLGLSVIAEGVETEEHYQFLLAHGCKAFQGYLFGRPLALDAFERQALAAPPQPSSAASYVI